MANSKHYNAIRCHNLETLMMALAEETGCRLSTRYFHRNMTAWLATKKKLPSTKKPKFYFSNIFFAKLVTMPSFSIEVKESKSQIRKTCYGFRHKKTGERVYLRVDPGSLVEFRVHLTGYVIGTRYVIPGLDKMRGPFHWGKVVRKMREYMHKNGIIVKEPRVAEYYKSIKTRFFLARKIVILKLRNSLKQGVINRKQYEKAISQVPANGRLH